MNKPTKKEILERARNLAPPSKELTNEQLIDQATELFFLNRLLDHNAMQLKNVRTSLKNVRLDLKRLSKERILLISIKKKWKS